LKARKEGPKVFRSLRAGIKAPVHTLKREHAKSTHGIYTSTHNLRNLASLQIIGSVKVLAHALLLGHSANLFLGFTLLFNSIRIVYYIAARERVVNIIFFSQAVDQSVWLLSHPVIILLLLKLHRSNLLPRKLILVQSMYLLALASWSIGQESIALMIAVLTSLASLIGLLASAERSLKTPRRTASALFLIFFLFPLIIIEAGSAVALISNLFHPAQPSLSDSTWLLPPVETNRFIHVETEISNIAYPATAYLMLLLFYSWAWKPLAKKLKEKVTKSESLRNVWPKRQPSTMAELPAFKEESVRGGRYSIRLGRTKSILIVGCAIAIGGFLALGPYISQSRFVGVDTKTYDTLLSQMTDLEAARKIILEDEAAGPKATYFMLLYLIKALTGLPSPTVVKIAAVIPASLLPISAYLLLRCATGKDSLAALSSLGAPLSFSTTVGMLAGVYANWLALSFILLSFTLLIKASSQNSRKILLASILTSTLVLVTHVLSWIVFIAVLFFYSFASFLAFRFWKQTEAKIDLTFSLTILLANGALVLLLLYSRNLSASTALLYIQTYSDIPIVSASSLLKFPVHLSRTLIEYVGGFYASPLVYFLAIVGALQGSFRRSFERLLYSWLIPTSIIFPLITSLDQWRIPYLMPIQILTGFGVYKLIEKASVLSPRQEAEGRRAISRLFRGSFLCFIILSLFNYTARSINLLFLLFRP